MAQRPFLLWLGIFHRIDEALGEAVPLVAENLAADDGFLMD